MSKRGSKGQTCVCWANMLPTCCQHVGDMTQKKGEGIPAAQRLPAAMARARAMATVSETATARETARAMVMARSRATASRQQQQSSTAAAAAAIPSTSINQVEQLICDVKQKLIIMIGKRARPPKKTNVLLLLVLMYHLNSILLWSVPYQFTCNLQ
jgi:hypothetical protein